MQQRKQLTLIYGFVSMIGVLIILTAVWYFNKDARYNKYKDYQDRFAIKYPASWSYGVNENNAEVVFYSPVENDLDYFRENLNIVIQDNSLKNLNIVEYTNLAIKQLEVVFKANLKIIESNDLVINNREGHRLVFEGYGDNIEYKFLTVWLLDGAQVYQITYTSLKSNYDKYVGHVEKMVSSFRIDH